jgi:hypothetical protein
LVGLKQQQDSEDKKKYYPGSSCAGAVDRAEVRVIRFGIEISKAMEYD